RARRSRPGPAAVAAAPWCAQPRRDLGRLALEQRREPLTDRLLPRGMLGEDLARYALAAREREQQMLVVRAALAAGVLGLLDRRLEDTLRTRRDAERRFAARVAAPDHALDRRAHHGFGEAELREHSARETAFRAQREQHMLGTEVAVAKPACRGDRARDDRARGLAEVLRPGQRSVDEALMRGLLRDPERD